MNSSKSLLLGVALYLASPVVWAYQTDANIESAAVNSYVFTNYLKQDHINVSSQDGVVTLTGTVADENHKFLAQNTVENLPDVKSVDDKLQVKRPFSDPYSDAWIGLKVKSALLFHRDVSAINTHVDVHGGVVTLTGYADNRTQRRLTAEYTADVDGVKDVVNNMEIRKTNPNPMPISLIDDASITAQIKLSLLETRWSAAIHTHVYTHNGVVTLTGTSNTSAERSQITQLVRNIYGVKRVINHIDIHAQD